MNVNANANAIRKQQIYEKYMMDASIYFSKQEDFFIDEFADYMRTLYKKQTAEQGTVTDPNFYNERRGVSVLRTFISEFDYEHLSDIFVAANPACLAIELKNVILTYTILLFGIFTSLIINCKRCRILSLLKCLDKVI